MKLLLIITAPYMGIALLEVELRERQSVHS